MGVADNMPSFKIYLSDWAGKNEITPAKTIESDSQYSAIIDYMSTIDSTHVATHIVVTGGLSRNLRVFTIREFNESIEKKQFFSSLRKKVNNATINEKNINKELKNALNPIENQTGIISVESDELKLGLTQFIICLFSNGLQFSKLIIIDGESYTVALDRYLLQFKDKWGSFLYQNNIWIKNADGDNKWCMINNQFAVEFEKNVRYQRAIREQNDIQIKVYNSNYRAGGENIFRVVAHDAVDAFRTYVISHKDEVYPVSLHYSNETKKESRYFDSSDYLVFVRGINSTKDVDHQLFKQFETRDYSTIEYLFRPNNETQQKHKQIGQPKSEKIENAEPQSNNNNPSVVSDCFEVFESKNENDNKHGIWTLLSWPIWIFVSVQLVKEFGKNRLSKIFDSAILYLAGGGFLIGILYFLGWIDRNRLELRIKSITSFVHKYPILYPPFFFVSAFLLSPWIMIGCFIVVMFLSALFGGGGRYSE